LRDLVLARLKSRQLKVGTLLCLAGALLARDLPSNSAKRFYGRDHTTYG